MINTSEKERENILLKLTKTSQEIRNSEEFQVYKDLLKIRSGFLICSINFFNLKREISHYYKNYPHLHDISTSLRSRIQYRITAQLYNSITSARSFVEYNYERHDFLETDISCFMKELRNHLAHSAPILLVSHINYVRNGPNERTESFEITGFKNELLGEINKSKNKMEHKEKALRFIESNETNNRINLNDLMQEYFQSVSEIYRSRLSNYVNDNKEVLNELVTSSKDILERMKTSGFYFAGVPLDKNKIRYLEFIFHTTNENKK